MEDQNLNGWQNIGAIQQWLMNTKHSLTPSEQSVYMCIVIMGVGYKKTTTGPLAHTYMAECTNIGIRTVRTAIHSLIDKEFIIKIGTNQVANTGKIAYAYQLKFRKDENFPYIDTGRDTKSKDKEIAKLEKQIIACKNVGAPYKEESEKLKQLKENK